MLMPALPVLSSEGNLGRLQRDIAFSPFCVGWLGGAIQHSRDSSVLFCTLCNTPAAERLLSAFSLLPSKRLLTSGLAAPSRACLTRRLSPSIASKTVYVAVRLSTSVEESPILIPLPKTRFLPALQNIIDYLQHAGYISHFYTISLDKRQQLRRLPTQRGFWIIL